MLIRFISEIKLTIGFKVPAGRRTRKLRKIDRPLHRPCGRVRDSHLVGYAGFHRLRMKEENNQASWPDACR